MIKADFNQSEVEALARELAALGKKLDPDLAVVVNKTTKKVRTVISREIRKELAASAKAVSKTLSIGRRATKSNTNSAVTLQQTRRIPLRDFGAKQNRVGVSYRISKRGGRKTLPGAFQGPKPGVIKASWKGHVFIRVGDSRLPIRHLKGPSPWGVFVKQGMQPEIEKVAQAELTKQTLARIAFRQKQNQGLLK